MLSKIFDFKSILARRRKRMRNRRRREVQVAMAARTFLFISRDGLAICKVSALKPYQLFRISESSEWREAIELWSPDFTGDVSIKGVEFMEKVHDYLTKREMKDASKLWRELLGLKNVTPGGLIRYLNILDPYGEEVENEKK